MKIQFLVFWIVTPCSGVVGKQREVQLTVDMDAALSCDTVVSSHHSTLRHNTEDNLERNYENLHRWISSPNVAVVNKS
jgi:hypothetical protein